MKDLYNRANKLYEELSETEYDVFVDWCIDKDIILDENDAHNLDWEDYDIYIKETLDHIDFNITKSIEEQEIIFNNVQKIDRMVSMSDLPYELKIEASTLVFSQKLILDRLHSMDKALKNGEVDANVLGYQLVRTLLFIEKGNKRIEELGKKIDKELNNII